MSSVSVVLDCVVFFKQKTAYEMRISDWSSDVCSSDLIARLLRRVADTLAFDPLARPGQLGHRDVAAAAVGEDDVRLPGIGRQHGGKLPSVANARRPLDLLQQGGDVDALAHRHRLQGAAPAEAAVVGDENLAPHPPGDALQPRAQGTSDRKGVVEGT